MVVMAVKKSKRTKKRTSKKKQATKKKLSKKKQSRKKTSSKSSKASKKAAKKTLPRSKKASPSKSKKKLSKKKKSSAQSNFNESIKPKVAPHKEIKRDIKDEVGEEILKRIREVFHPIQVSLNSTSHLHKKHPQAKVHGGGHYQIKVVSDLFTGLSMLQRQQWMNSVLHDMYHKQIHALQMILREPEEEGYGF